jgi:hypothetical protein
MADGIQLRVASDTISSPRSTASTALRQTRPRSWPRFRPFMVQRGQRHIETETGPTGQMAAACRPGRLPSVSAAGVAAPRTCCEFPAGSTARSQATAARPKPLPAPTRSMPPSSSSAARCSIPAREQQIHLVKTNRGRRFAKASAKRAESRVVKIGAHTITIPARTLPLSGRRRFRRDRARSPRKASARRPTSNEQPGRRHHRAPEGDQPCPFSHGVGGAADFASIDSVPTALPAAYV